MSDTVPFIPRIADQQVDQGAFLWTLRDGHAPSAHTPLCDRKRGRRYARMATRTKGLGKPSLRA